MSTTTAVKSRRRSRHRLHLRRLYQPTGADGALRNYRQQFQAQDFGLDTPRAILAVNVTVGDTAADGQRLVGSAKGFYSLLRRCGASVTVLSAEEAAGLLTTAEEEQPTAIIDGQWPRFVAGSPDEVRTTLEQMIDERGADELMIQNLIADPHDRRHSHQLLADMFGLALRTARTEGFTTVTR